MKERVGHSGGFLAINSAKGTGTTIQAQWST
jgi:signal transduction histidine kinase